MPSSRRVAGSSCQRATSARPERSDERSGPLVRLRSCRREHAAQGDGVQKALAISRGGRRIALTKARTPDRRLLRSGPKRCDHRTKHRTTVAHARLAPTRGCCCAQPCPSDHHAPRLVAARSFRRHARPGPPRSRHRSACSVAVPKPHGSRTPVPGPGRMSSPSGMTRPLVPAAFRRVDGIGFGRCWRRCAFRTGALAHVAPCMWGRRPESCVPAL